MIILLCGIIGSGQEEFAAIAAKGGIFTVCGDSIVRMLHAGDYSLYRKENTEVYSKTELGIIISSLNEGRDILVNRQCFQEKNRKRYVTLAKWFESPIMAVTFPRLSPLEHAEQRFKLRPDGHSLEQWIEVASRQHSQWETPRQSEGFDNIVPVDVAIEMANEGKL